MPVEGIADKYRHDPDAGNWVIPRSRMKRKDKDLKQADRIDHAVPIPPVLLSLLREWRKADGPDAVYVCPAPRDESKPITPESTEKFYQRALDLKGKHSPHSWRSAFCHHRQGEGEKRRRGREPAGSPGGIEDRPGL